jgi:pyruvate dehydrogenase (quinone)
MAQLVADVLAGVLEQIRVRKIFGPRSFSQPTARRGSSQQDRWTGVRHEEGAARAAGQAKLTGRFGVCAGANTSGEKVMIQKSSWLRRGFLAATAAAFGLAVVVAKVMPAVAAGRPARAHYQYAVAR